jgi:hypothetical protein
MRVGLTVAITVLAGLAAAAAPPGRQERLALSINSWGKPLYDWRVSVSGEAVYTYARDAGRHNFSDYDLVTKRFRVPAPQLRRLRALLAPGRSYAGRTLPCGDEITDMPYGRIAWNDAFLSYNLGCRSAEARPVYEGLEAAQDLIEALAKKAPVAEVKPVRQPTG